MSEAAKLSYTIDEAAAPVGVSRATAKRKPFPPAWKLSYNLNEVCAALGLKLGAVRRLIERGDLQTFSWGGRALVCKDALNAYTHRRDNPPPPEPEPQPPAIPQSGVYLLYQRGALTYVGRARNLRQRMNEHRSSGRVFDEARFIACDPEAANWLEAELIRVLQPPENVLRYARRAKASEASLAGLALQ